MATENLDMDYSKYDFKDSTEMYVHLSKKGLSKDTVREISKLKDEPEWMLDFRLRSYDIFMKKPMPQWGGDLNKIDGIIFTSVSSVQAFFEIMQKDHDRSKLVDMLHETVVISIGPFNADELKKLNVENVIADVHTVPGSFDAIVKALSLAEAI